MIRESAIKVISRMMGLILAVHGVQLFIEGIHGAMKLQF
ncbi:MarC family protein [Endozoicomonas sp. OPT23]